MDVVVVYPVERHQQRDACESLAPEKGAAVSLSPQEKLTDMERSENHICVVTTFITAHLDFLEDSPVILLQVDSLLELILRKYVHRITKVFLLHFNVFNQI